MGLRRFRSVYGRSPVMKALPDIKTANKVVELILKNASISVTGIWQADDDGVLNPANVRLVPGAIIPKAVGSKGLTLKRAPENLTFPSWFWKICANASTMRCWLTVWRKQYAGDDRDRSFGAFCRDCPHSGASFGRLQSELLTPLLKRAFCILRRRGDIMNFDLDGKIVDLQV